MAKIEMRIRRRSSVRCSMTVIRASRLFGDTSYADPSGVPSAPTGGPEPPRIAASRELSCGAVATGLVASATITSARSRRRSRHAGPRCRAASGVAEDPRTPAPPPPATGSRLGRATRTLPSRESVRHRTVGPWPRPLSGRERSGRVGVGLRGGRGELSAPLLVVVVQQQMEIEEVVVGETGPPGPVVEVVGPTPVDPFDPRRGQQLADRGAGLMGDCRSALGASEAVRPRPVIGADPDGQIACPQPNDPT